MASLKILCSAKSAISFRRDPARWGRAIRDLNCFLDSQLEHPRWKARRGSIDRYLTNCTTGNNDRLWALSNGIESSTHWVGAAASLVGQVTAGLPGIGYDSQRVVPRVVDYYRVGAQWRWRFIAILSEEVVCDEPILGARPSRVKRCYGGRARPRLSETRVHARHAPFRSDLKPLCSV